MLCQATENTTGKEPASEAYRQVSYVNDVTRANEQALVEYVTNGALGNSAISYTYGVQRESYAMTQYAATAGGITEALTSHSSGIYYYTGTGSVSNLTSSGGNYAYTYSEYGARTVYRTDADGYTDVTAISYTYEGYGYKGEYTHEALGIQYLRARYYSMGTGTFTSKDTYAGRIESILSQNRYTYVENNPVNFADPSGHAKGKGGLSSLEDNIRIANGGNGPAYKQPVNNPQAAAKAAYQKRREDAGLPNENTLLDNARIYNGQEYYNNLLLRTPITTLMTSSGGAFTYAESVAAKVEAAVCKAYARCMNELQEEIKNNILSSVEVVPDDSFLYLDGIVIRNGESIIIIPEVIMGTVDGKKFTLDPSNNWYSYGKETDTQMVNDRYKINVGVKIVDPDYPDSGRLQADEFEKLPELDIILEDKETGQTITIPCIVTNLKAHTYNEYPTENHPVDNGHTASFPVESGLVQTGIAYPNSYNAKNENPCSVAHADGSIIEFIGNQLKFNPEDYILKEVIVK